jgi:hypothetical protein
MSCDLNKKFSGGFDPINTDILKIIEVKPSKDNEIFITFVTQVVFLFSYDLAERNKDKVFITYEKFISIAPFLKELEDHFTFINTKITIDQINQEKIILLSEAFYQYICDEVKQKVTKAKRKPTKALNQDISLILKTACFLETKTNINTNIITAKANKSLNIALDVIYDLLDELEKTKSSNRCKNIFLKETAYFKQEASVSDIKKILQDINKTHNLKLDTYLKNMINALVEAKNNIVKILLSEKHF